MASHVKQQRMSFSYPLFILHCYLSRAGWKQSQTSSHIVKLSVFTINFVKFVDNNFTKGHVGLKL